MFKYRDKEYSSKAAVVRELYDSGQASLDISHKKKLAEELDMTIQTVHATIMKHIKKMKKPEKTEKKVTPVVTQVKKKVKDRSSNKRGPIFINDEKEEVKEELMKDDGRIAITWAPNQWGLPVTNPPMYVIDDNYDPDWQPEPEDLIERIWE
ncbi:MAG: hypothetical protein ACOC80_06665 [Petrotogales bacterium]